MFCKRDYFDTFVNVIRKVPIQTVEFSNNPSITRIDLVNEMWRDSGDNCRLIIANSPEIKGGLNPKTNIEASIQVNS